MASRIYLDKIDSTNRYAAENKNSLQLPACIITYWQTEGKGQGGNRWMSEKGKNLLLSYVYKPLELPSAKSFYVSKIAALAVSEFLRRQLSEIEIKWPNDILCSGRKIAGILIENSISGSYVYSSILGIGLNINQSGFPDFSPGLPASSIAVEKNESMNIGQVTDDVIEVLGRWIHEGDMHNFELIDDLYHKNLFRRGKWASYRDKTGEFEGRIQAVKDDGHLSMELRDGSIREFAYKEMEYIV